MTTTIDKRLTRFFQADPELIANPFNLYRDLRQTGPVGCHFIQIPGIAGYTGGPNEQR